MNFFAEIRPPFARLTDLSGPPLRLWPVACCWIDCLRLARISLTLGPLDLVDMMLLPGPLFEVNSNLLEFTLSKFLL